MSSGRNYTQLNYPILWKLAKKIELATQLQTQTQMAASPMQVTNYGLGGLCEIHVDPHGYIQGNEVPKSRDYLYDTGDMIGTFMAWLKDTEAGGGTGYVTPGYEGIVSCLFTFCQLIVYIVSCLFTFLIFKQNIDFCKVFCHEKLLIFSILFYICQLFICLFISCLFTFCQLIVYIFKNLNFRAKT